MMAPSRDEIGLQLERLLSSEPFANAERASRFLRYVVERTLAGEGDRLKEFVIGVDVFDRGDQYDPRIDSIVRVEAGRLRTKLDHYYSRVAGDDRVVIRIQRGSYVPEFDYRTPDRTRSRPSRQTPDVEPGQSVEPRSVESPSSLSSAHGRRVSCQSRLESPGLRHPGHEPRRAGLTSGWARSES